MGKSFSISIKALALLLAVLTVAYLLPMTVFGEMVADSGENAESAENTSSSTETGLTPEQLLSENYFKPEEEIPADALCEDTSKRESNVKQFLMSDGSYTMAVYAQNVHYKDEAGEWQDIDNTLTDSGSEFSNANARVKFSKKIPGNEGIFTLHEHNRKITVSLEGAIKKTVGKVTNRVTDHGENATELQKMTTLDKLNASVFYADILEDTDLEYVLNGSDIKENIIIKEKGDEYVYVFTLQLNNLTAELVGNEVLLCDGEEHIYTIPAPFMLDASGVRSDSVTYTLTDGGNGKYTLTVTADAEWINSEERAFPVTVDPAIERAQLLDVNIETATVYCTTDPDFGYDDPENSVYDNNLTIGYVEYELYYRGYIGITGLNMLTPNSEILKASIGLMQEDFWYLFYSVTNSQEQPLQIVMRQCEEWIPGQLTWNTQPSIVNTNAIYSNSANGTANDTYCYWEITDYLQNVISTGENELYLSMQTYGDYTNGFPCTSYSRHFYTETSENQPFITITHKKNTGIEDYWSTTNQSVGFAGNGYVNNRTGELTFIVDTLSSTDYLMPITVSIVYSSLYANQRLYSSTSLLPYASPLTSNGVRVSVQQTIVPIDVNNTRYYVMTDSDGTEHLFCPTNESGIYSDTDGLGLILSVTNTAYTVTDKNGNYYKFQLSTSSDMGGVLTRIIDANGNSLIIDVTDDNLLKPQSIQLLPAGYERLGKSPITQLQFLYNTAGVISAIYNPHTFEACIFLYSSSYDSAITRSSSNYLRKLLYVSGNEEISTSVLMSYTGTAEEQALLPILASATYTYSIDGKLISATDVMHSRSLNYNYDSRGRVSDVCERTSIGSTGQKYSFMYSTYSTKIRTSGANDVYGDSDDTYTNYVFDEQGRTAVCYTTDLSGNKRYVYDIVSYNDSGAVRNSISSTITKTGSFSNYLKNGGFEKDISDWVTTTVSSSNISYTGNKSARLSFASSMSQYMYLPAGQYTLSMYMLVIIEDNVSSNFDLTIESSSGDKIKQITKTFTVDEDYTLFTTKLTVENPARYSITISHTSSSASNNIYVDDVMLAFSDEVQETDLLSFGSFETENSNSYFGSAKTSILQSDGIDGNYLCLNTGETQSNEYTALSRRYVMIERNVRKYRSSVPSTFTLSAFAKDTMGVIEYGRVFRIIIKAYYTEYDGTSNQYCETYYLDFKSGLTEWFLNAITFTENNSVGKISSITLQLEYNGTGRACFDSIALVESSEKSANYKYAENGKLAALYNSRIASYNLYNEYDDIIAQISTIGDIKLYQYDSRHRVTETLSIYGDPEKFFPLAITELNSSITAVYTLVPLYAESYCQYEYNAFGQDVKTISFDIFPEDPSDANEYGDITYYGIVFGDIRIEYLSETNEFPIADEFELSPNVNETKHFINSATYKTDGNTVGALLTETSDIGKVTRYFYDAYGRISACIMPNGEGLVYSYDAIGNVELVYPVTYTTDVALNNETNSEPLLDNSAYVQYNYIMNDVISSIVTPSTVYRFNYNTFGNVTSVSNADYILAEYVYNPNNGKLSRIDFRNNSTDGKYYKIFFNYDELERISKIEHYVVVGQAEETHYGEYEGEYTVLVDVYEKKTLCSYTYNKDGTVKTLRDAESVTTFIYDVQGRIVKALKEFLTESVESVANYSIDGNILSSHYSYSNISSSNSSVYFYYYNADKSLSSIINFGADSRTTQSYSYDRFGRINTDTLEVNSRGDFTGIDVTLTRNYEYAESGKVQSSLISVFSSLINDAFSEYMYTYDQNGNITEINDASGSLYRYRYDKLGQLIREDNFLLNKTYVYSYDSAGNILSKTTYDYTYEEDISQKSSITVNYTYQTGTDRMTKYNNQSCNYDAMGNPVRYRGTYLSWQGRTLIEYGSNYTYKYNYQGIRTSKIYTYDTENGYSYATHYVLDGNRVVQVNGGDDVTRYTAFYYYDGNGRPYMMKYRPSASSEYSYYIYDTNLHGDVVAVYTAQGTKIVSYTYDAWGNFVTNVHIPQDSFFVEATLFRYRGYIYDYESGFYYLQSRYYDPEIGRFINMDDTSVITASPMALTDKNLYAYCDNNPIMRVDGDGAFWDTIFDVISLCVSVAEVCATPANPWAWLGLVGDAADLIPFITGAGETIKMLGASQRAAKILDNVDEVRDAKKAFENMAELAENGQDGFKTFRTVKKNLKKENLELLDLDTEWHHIVEQSSLVRNTFERTSVNNPYNLVGISREYHQKISRFYSMPQAYTGGLPVRQWISQFNFQQQYTFGLYAIQYVKYI